ncbi:MAG: glycosyltransferase family 4 protein [Syntrophobacteraceae bacterium]
MQNNAEKIRVLMSGHISPPMGGVAAFYESLLASSLPEKVNLRFVLTSSQKRELASSGAFTLFNLSSAFADCIRFTKAHLAHRPQVSHIPATFGLSFLKHSACVLIAKLLGSRVILHPHCSLKTLYTGKSICWQRFFRLVVDLVDGMIALSSEWRELCASCPELSMYQIPNAIDLSPYREAAREQLAKRHRSGPFKVFYMGYLGKAKGSFDLVDAAKLVLDEGLDAVFDLVGDELTPGERSMLSEHIQRVVPGDRVRLHPGVFDSRKLDFFRTADIFIYPSHHEGMPIAVIEAMASALAIVATRVGGLPDLVVDGKNGILVQSERPDQMTSAILRLARDENTRYSMQQKSCQVAMERFGMEQRVDQFVSVYRAVYARKRISL